MRFNMLRGAALSTMVVIVSGCSLVDPNERAGVWHPRGVNDGNLAVMVADPHDLVSGKESTVSDGILASAAVDRLHRGKAKALPTATISPIAVSVTNSSSSGGSE